MRSIACASRLRVRQRRARGVRRHVRGRFAGRGDAALMDAGALHDPFVGGIDLARQIGVGEDLVRQIAAAAEDNGTAHRHERGSAERRLRGRGPVGRAPP